MMSKGFDIVIGNPPYVSNKATTELEKDLYSLLYGKSDDLYHYFFQRAFKINKGRGLLGYITSDTYMAIGTKKDLRKLLQSKRICELLMIGTAFRGVGISTNIIIIQNSSEENYFLRVANGIESFETPERYRIKNTLFQDGNKKTFFLPSLINMELYKKYNEPLKKLMKEWWSVVETSKKIKKNKESLESYRKKLQSGDITLLGLITDGGVGLQTGDNGKLVGVLRGHKIAERILLSRPKKLWNFVNKKKEIPEILRFISLGEVKKFLSEKTEAEIRTLFDTLKEKYGKNIFGVGYLFRIVAPSERADVISLTDKEKVNGLQGNSPYVPYDKGDKEGNRWSSETPYYISWTRENVDKLKKSRQARWQGYDFFFQRGFCCGNVLNRLGTRAVSFDSNLIKCRLKEVSVNDVGAMSLYPLVEKVPVEYLVCLMNSSLITHYLRHFINTTINLQINDFRQLPFIIPNKEQKTIFKRLFTSALDIKKREYKGEITRKEAEEELKEFQEELDQQVNLLFQISERF